MIEIICFVMVALNSFFLGYITSKEVYLYGEYKRERKQAKSNEEEQGPDVGANEPYCPGGCEWCAWEGPRIKEDATEYKAGTRIY